MDPLTQGAIGAALPQATRRTSQVGVAGLFGFLSGMTADLDVFIQSSNDTLLYLEYHRYFTHSLLFIPVGGLLAALVLHLILGRRWKLAFHQTLLFCTLGYATQGLLDAATSYGTVLFWPFSDERVAWKVISVIDPLFTLPVLLLIILAAVMRNGLFARIALAWVALYLGLATVQQHAALAMGREIAQGRGHVPVRLEARPSFGNILVWKTLYEADGRYHVDAVRAGLAPRVFEGESIAKLDIARDLPWLDTGTQQAKDIERFRYFSDGFISRDPVLPDRIIDVRYSMLPNQVAALWSIELARDAGPADHARFQTHRGDPSKRLRELWR
ncbi:MAG: metal-dependent hydrolase, partial [Pirellulales bacterium]|nr:metal-dependent hydrolase [Pirellulales bacterium]